MCGSRCSPSQTSCNTPRNFPYGPKLKVETHRAVKVKIRVNVQEILKVDQVQETFTAIFVLNFYYVDPALRNFTSNVRYLDDGGIPRDVVGRIVGCCGHDGQTQTLIECEEGW